MKKFLKFDFPVSAVSRVKVFTLWMKLFKIFESNNVEKEINFLFGKCV
jgi:hypothetical protein